MDLVCLDTDVVIWGIKGEATPGQEDMVPRAKAFLKNLDDKGTRVLIPAVVVAELLIKVQVGLHSDVLSFFQRRFIIGDFDLPASSHFARIWQTRMDDQTIPSLQSAGVFRTKLRADCMIVATAIAHGASCIYSHDRGVHRFAEGHILVAQIPELPEQLDLFTE